MNSAEPNPAAPYSGFVSHTLDEHHCLYVGRLPSKLVINDLQFEELWNIHPDEFHEIMMHGRPVKTPRWQQAYGKDYHYTGNVNKALPVPSRLQPLLQWAQNTIDLRLNGMLLNWYTRDVGVKARRITHVRRTRPGGMPATTFPIPSTFLAGIPPGCEDLRC
jgi:hypothetical protein